MVQWECLISLRRAMADYLVATIWDNSGQWEQINEAKKVIKLRARALVLKQ